MPLSPDEFALIECWQRGFPLTKRPYAEMGKAVGLDEQAVIACLGRLNDAGVLSRVGATVRPNSVGASTLAAMHVPPEQLDLVALRVSSEPAVNHNYEREHHFNLWFVVTAADRDSVRRVLQRLRVATGFDVLDLPLEKSYFIDLGFSLTGDGSPKSTMRDLDFQVDAVDCAILLALEHGLPLTPEPFDAVARDAGLPFVIVLERLRSLIAAGVITRFGLIVRHRELGYVANAMAVWDILDSDVDQVAAKLAVHPAVTLCYRRPRRLPHWPYNLFCMVHGRERRTVEEIIATLTREQNLEDTRHAVLFSCRRFKQRGAKLFAA